MAEKDRKEGAGNAKRKKDAATGKPAAAASDVLSGGLADFERPIVTAKAKYVRTAPRKARLVAEQIRGKSVEEARATLLLSTRGAAIELEKLLNSAVANAEHNLELDEEDLTISELKVDEGPTLKRYRPRAMGRATPIHKRTCHIALSLTTYETGSQSNQGKAN